MRDRRRASLPQGSARRRVRRTVLLLLWWLAAKPDHMFVRGLRGAGSAQYYVCPSFPRRGRRCPCGQRPRSTALGYDVTDPDYCRLNRGTPIDLPAHMVSS